MLVRYHRRMHSPPPFPSVSGPSWPGVRILTTLRQGGVSTGPYGELNLGDHVGDEPGHVQRNRAILQEAVPGAPLWLRQVHGTVVHEANGPATHHAPEADAAVTDKLDQVLAVLTADCLPVVIVDDAARALGVAHAGWRGLAAGVLEATVAAVRQRAGPGAMLRAWIGPAIGPSAFEVGPDVRDAFADMPQAFNPNVATPGKWWADLPWLAQQRLRKAGVVTVVQSGLCTVSDDRFFSYRRDGVTGRFATLAWLEGTI